MEGFIVLTVLIVLCIVSMLSKIPLLQIITGLMCIAIAVAVTTTIAYPLVNIFALFVSIAVLFNAYERIRG